jgi:PAS domain S-box-containing protein
MGVLSLYFIEAANTSSQWVLHTHEVLENLDAILLDIQKSVTSSERFVLTGDESNAEAFHASVTSAEQHEVIFGNQTADNPEQQHKLPVLAALLVQEVQYAETAMSLRRAKELEAATDEARSGRAQQVMTDLETVVRQAQDSEKQLLALRNLAATRLSRQREAVLILGTFLGLLITAAAFRSVLRDNSRRRLVERALFAEKENAQVTLSSIGDAVISTNVSGNVTFLNLVAERMTGWSCQEAVDRPVAEVFPLLDVTTREPTPVQMETALERHRAVHQPANRILVGRDGSETWIEERASPIRDREGRATGAVIIFRDISVRRDAESTLARKVEELSRSNEELGQFAYIASHDLQEPLRMVASYTQLLARRYKGKLDSNADEYITFAVDGANRMQRLIQDLLLYSRVGTKGNELLDTSSEGALLQALGSLRAAIRESGALVTHDPLPTVLADRSQLAQLFQNLVGNAIKYQNGEIPQVHISAARNGGKKWLFSVKDNGLGIEPQYFERIFGMFQRLHKRDEFAGTGIGLAICKKIVERHGGAISVESQSGQGSTFRFTLAESGLK